ncbi:MAG: bifunctional (p)ppGpp synthetase/guanosine-3',5'-bis(diphosphate) 3'-pyrophosphohydrolase [Kofleriaceae bacterium]|nr:bifunctional (p)ppGpp synthetase/guanosine-3',5'-bis(diphosphate) 3'-pyrophosphohydrolase [Kofleriaceae bacterium]MCL4225369.1 HD domain-containing protein [Myxococcales bacterium]
MWSPERYQASLRFAAERHAGQTVPGTHLPYLLHVTSVAGEVMRAIVLEPVAAPDLAVVCALLHDVVEDTPTPLAEIAARFGDDVALGVAALSKDAALAKAQQLDDSLRRIRACPAEIWVVKLADRIVNLQEPPPHWSGDKRRRYRDEARQIHAALAPAHALLGRRLDERIDAYGAFLT